MNKLLQLGILFCGLSCFSQVNLTANLKVCLPFNGNANDLSGSSNNGAVNGATLTTDRFGTTNSAYQFNGTSDFISLANFATIAPTNELTISIWAKCDLTTSNCLFMLSPDNASDRCLGAAQYSNSGNTMMIWDYGNIYSSGRTIFAGIPIDITNWHHYVYITSQTGNVKQMYLDGVINSNSTYVTACINKSLPFYIGAGTDGTSGGNLRFHGKIDDVCIYNRALNSNEVTALYTGTGACFTVGIDELASFSNGIFYPTISQDGKISYSGEVTKLSEVHLYSIDGKLLKSFSQAEISNNDGKLNLNNYSKGLYFLKVIKEGSEYIQKIIIDNN
jgi:hypothetical protein